ncbi:hypothetical protein P4646_23595 [Peribacillus simplex]|uniref:hypothetical protein n=1 Tax=Peribacillus simplex TaxID=1478 RepID=UPI001E2D1130|nr:hypothetical protein [Peribacillus simplex]MED3912377.1 hypothetical protein [Peribacillus simplex]MED3987014.1 hypothetical protein [Peribacillus simplex]MED4094286.1 hypothetical protein [Peribacillus simplex]
MPHRVPQQQSRSGYAPILSAASQDYWNRCGKSDRQKGLLILRPEGANAFDQIGIDRSHPVTVFTRIGNINPKNIKAIFEPIPIRKKSSAAAARRFWA